jgi:hypothetical protein
MGDQLGKIRDRLQLAPSGTSFLVTSFLKADNEILSSGQLFRSPVAVAREEQHHMVTDLENCWSVLIRTMGKGHDKIHLSNAGRNWRLGTNTRCSQHQTSAVIFVALKKFS